jgi:hypothetical protein
LPDFTNKFALTRQNLNKWSALQKAIAKPQN